MANIDSFKAAMIGGGARANAFRVDLAFPTVVTGGSASALMGQFMIKAASLPESNVGKTSAYYRGREVKLAGEREFAPWTVTAYNDTNFMIRNSFEKWSNAMNDNISNGGIIRPSDYMADLTVTQLDRNGNEVKQYKMVGAWPQLVGNIELAYESNNEVETFPITFEYQRWESQGITDGGSGFGVNLSVTTPFGTF